MAVAVEALRSGTQGVSQTPQLSPEQNDHRTPQNGQVTLVPEAQGTLVQLHLPGDLEVVYKNGGSSPQETVAARTNGAAKTSQAPKEIVVQIGYFQGGSRMVGNGTGDAHTIASIRERIDQRLSDAHATLKDSGNGWQFKDEEKRVAAVNDAFILSNVEVIQPYPPPFRVRSFSR